MERFEEGIWIFFNPTLAILIFYSVASTGALSDLLTQERISLIVFIPTLLGFYIFTMMA